MARSARALILLALALVACDAKREARATRATEARPAEAPPSAPPDERSESAGCEALATNEIGEGAPDSGSIALAVDRERAMIAVADAARAGSLWLRPLTPTGRPRGAARELRLPATEGLVGLEPLGEGFVVLGRGGCDDDAQCLSALRVDAEGRALGESLGLPLPAAPRTLRRARGADAVFVAWSTTTGHRGLWRIRGDGAEALPLGEIEASEDAPVEILGLAADGSRFAVVWRRGPVEDARSVVYLDTEGSHTAAEGLHEALALEAFAWRGDEVMAIASFEFSAPHLVVMAPGQEEPLQARPVAADAVLEAPFDSAERAELTHDAGALWLRRRSAAGFSLGERELVHRGRYRGAALTRSGSDLLVAWLTEREGEDRLRVTNLRCARPESAD